MYRAFVITALLGSLAAACGTFEVSVDRGATAVATSVLASIPAPASPTQARAAAAPTPGTATMAATSAVQDAVRIQFAPGATQNVMQGTLEPGQTRTFVLQAAKGQVLIASVDSPPQDVSLAIFGPDRAPLLESGSNSFSGTLPATQDYYFQLTGGAAAHSFTLDITVAARIEFAPGAKRSVITGRTVGGLSVIYSAYALQGQRMHITLDVPGEDAGLTIWGLANGEPYARAQNDVRDFSLVLPAGQDYMIQVMPRAGQVVDYTLTVEIE